jgi:hypothetical protein
MISSGVDKSRSSVLEGERRRRAFALGSDDQLPHFESFVACFFRPLSSLDPHHALVINSLGAF